MSFFKTVPPPCSEVASVCARPFARSLDSLTIIFERIATLQTACDELMSLDKEFRSFQTGLSQLGAVTASRAKKVRYLSRWPISWELSGSRRSCRSSCRRPCVSGITSTGIQDSTAQTRFAELSGKRPSASLDSVGFLKAMWQIRSWTTC